MVHKVQECPADKLTAVLEIADADDERTLQRLDELLRDYELDPRLHFLRGSVLAGLQRYGEAHEAMRRAVEIAPGFDVARFQLGFLELTSGDPAAAELTWRPFQRLDPNNYFRLFALGLHHLVRDEFREAIECLRDGMERNTDNAPLNGNIQLLIDEIVSKQAVQDSEKEAVSAAHLLLKKYSKPTKH